MACLLYSSRAAGAGARDLAGAARRPQPVTTRHLFQPNSPILGQLSPCPVTKPTATTTTTNRTVQGWGSVLGQLSPCPVTKPTATTHYLFVCICYRTEPPGDDDNDESDDEDEDDWVREMEEVRLVRVRVRDRVS